MKVASSGTESGLLKLIKEFHYSENIEIISDHAVNIKLEKQLGKIVKKGKKLEYHI